MSNLWADYVLRVTAGMTQSAISQATGVAQTAISRWIRGDDVLPRAEKVVEFARALDQNPVEALIAAGYLTAKEANAQTNVKLPLREYSTNELLEDLRRRTVEGNG